MSALGTVGLQDSATALLASQTDQTAGQSTLTPFCGKLNVDEKLKLGRENFKQLIEEFCTDKDITPVTQLTATPHFPTPHVFAQFASKTYTGYKKQETDAQYETRLALPDGWKLLTTASHSSKTNGYFGAAYWHPENQQVVIAHRGTKLTSLGALWTDIVGVVFKHFAPQMCSASTFAHKVVEVLQEVNRMKGICFQLFFTGHSLGGWLAQVTTFTTEYLEIEGKLFQGRNKDNECYHPHTVVFESPGCKDMLSEMRDKFYERLDGRSILEHLDITSYLSAPNRINTCNKHLGTVYRIFTDLSEMDGHSNLRGTVYRFFSRLSDTVWQIKRSALYTSTTHSMENILQAFDPETGQVYENEQGQLKVKVVTDWPISTGLQGGEEYKKFFEWAEHLNNYHPDTEDKSCPLLNNREIRYRTEIYVEGENSISVFSQEEQKFLQCYLRLRECPKPFKSKELFSLIKHNRAQKEAEKILQSFNIEDGKIIRKGGIALQTLVPYVKRLIELFPEVKEIGNRFWQCETNSCIEQIEESPLDFNRDALNVREFLADEQQQVLQLQMVDSDGWAGLIKVYRVLQKSNFLTEGRYTVLTLERLLSLNMLADFRTLMQSVKEPYRILVACEASQQLKAETKEMIRKLFETMKQKSCIKIIFTTRSEGRGADILQQTGREIFGNGFVTRKEELNWCDLTPRSQKKLLKKSVTFQGTKISLNVLMSAKSPAAKFLPLGALLEEKELKIVDPVPNSNGYDESYYIGRTLQHGINIQREIFSDEDVKNGSVFLVSTEKKFKELCKMNRNNNVHWLEKDKSANLLWQQSQGSLATLRRYIDIDSSHTYTADDLVKLLGQAQHQRVMLISDTAGMGKSTVLTHLSKHIKHNFPAKWVVRIDLNNHTDALKELEQELKGKTIDKEKAIKFVSGKVLKLKQSLEVQLFKQCCEQKQKLRIIIMLDGFDEISPSYEKTVLDLVQGLRQTAVEQLWVTTRPHLKNELEDKLEQLSYTLEPFSEEDQIAFLSKFWSLKNWFTEMENKGEEECKQKLQIYAEQLIKKLSVSISDKDRQFTGIPLQTRMLAEAIEEEEVEIFCQSSESLPELNVNLELLNLYKRFIKRKYIIYQEEKLQLSVSKAFAIQQRKSYLKVMKKDYQQLALKVLFTEEQVALIESKIKCTFSIEQLTSIGIVQVSHDGKLHFIHRTFAEYFVADCLVNRLIEGNNFSKQWQTFILKDIFLELNYEVIRVFIDRLLLRCNPSNEVLKQWGNWINDFGDHTEIILHRAAREGNANIFGFLLDSAQAAGHTEAINKLLLGKVEGSGNTWNVAAERGNIEVIKKIWRWAEEKMTEHERKNELLLGTDDVGRTAWQNAAFWGKVDVIQKIWDLAKERLETEEIKNEILLRTDCVGRNAWHIAAIGGEVDVMQKIWELSKETLTTEEIKNEILLSTDGEGETAWHIAASGGEVDVMQKIWELAKEGQKTEEIRNEMLLATNNAGWNAWHTAALKGKLHVIQKIWKLAKKRLPTEEIKNKILLRTNSVGRNAWHIAAFWGNLDVMERLWELAKKRLTTKEIKNEMLLRTDRDGRNAWHIAAYWGKLDVMQRLWELAKDTLTKEEIKNEILLSTDGEGTTAWHIAASGGKVDVMQKIWELAKEGQTTEEIRKEMLLATNNTGWNAWHTAAFRGKLDVIEKIWDLAKERLTTEEIKNEMLLRTDVEGRNAWHIAAFRGEVDVMQKILELAKERLTTVEIKNEMLLCTDGEEWNAWHTAALRAN